MLRDEIRNKLEECFVKAEKHYGITLPRPKLIHFKTSGTTGGWSNYGKKEMMFHLIFAKENREDYFKNTIPHEAAHWVCDHIHGLEYRKDRSGRKIIRNGRYICDHHGPNWQRVMLECYNLQPDRCHSYSTENVKTRKVRRWNYECVKCGEVSELTTHGHNKVQKYLKGTGRNYYSCKCCNRMYGMNHKGHALVFVGEKKASPQDQIAELQKQIAALQANS